jgi:hypothetical protein
MGTVDISTAETGSIDQLMKLWENYFFNSYFSHLMSDHNPVNGNCVMLWENLIDNGKLFPTEMLVKTSKNLKTFYYENAKEKYPLLGQLSVKSNKSHPCKCNWCRRNRL